MKYPVKKRDVMAAKDIFGTDIVCLKIKTVRKSSQQVPHSHTRMAIPTDVHEQYCLVKMSIDIIFVKKISFFVSISQGLKFVSAKYIANRQHDTITACIKQLCSL